MKKQWLLIVIFSQVYGCAGQVMVHPQAQELFPYGQTLWEARIGRGDSQLFAGLLALNKRETGLEAVLLDATGIKLLHEMVLPTGEVTVISALPPVKNKRLGPFLGEGLFRLFFNPEESAGGPCWRDGLFELCFGADDEGRLVKFRKLGPFLLWSGDYSINYYDSPPAITGARLNGGWLTPYLELKKSGATAGK